MTNLKATWTRIVEAEPLQRSSHTINVVGNQGFVFGGELLPRQPRDNDVLKVDLQANGIIETDANSSNEVKPSPRVGAASATLDDKIYVFSGRGGLDMAPIEENGSLWVFDTKKSAWSHIHPADQTAPFPQARSYHCATSDGSTHVYIHAGCPASGRLQDIWSFDVESRVWQQLADAPEPARGGPSIAFVDGSLFRMNGFDGKTEQGGSVDILDLRERKWMPKQFEADNRHGPAPRSVGTLLPISIDTTTYLVTVCGEGDPSALGHAGAGKMFGDVWAYDIKANRWHEVKIAGFEHPVPRGWFSADKVDDRSIAISGGLDEGNARLNDVWLLSFN